MGKIPEENDVFPRMKDNGVEQYSRGRKRAFGTDGTKNPK